MPKRHSRPALDEVSLHDRAPNGVPRLLTEAQVLSMVDIWLTTPFEGGRHLTRIQKLDY